MTPQSTSPYEELARATAEAPDLPLVSFIGAATHTRAELLAAARDVGRALTASGVAPGDRVALMIGNRFEFLATWMGIQAAGGISVPLNTSMRGRVLEHMLELSAPKLVVAEAGLAPVVTAAGCAAECVWLDGAGGTGATWEDFLRRGHLDRELPSVRGTEAAHILFTSGTTGPSKGVTWSGRTALAMAEGGIRVLDYRAEDVVFTCLPLFHSNALFTTFVGALMRRARVVVAERFTASGFWDQVATSGATTISLLGSMIPILRKREPTQAERSHRVRLALVIPVDRKERGEFLERYGIPCTTLYGLTDVGTPIGVPFGEDGGDSGDSCGRELPDWECVLVDADDQPVPVGTIGELLVRPRIPNISQLGYWRMPEQTVEAWRNLWLHTGDLMRQDEDGWFHFVDRRKDAIRRFGENISSYEVEQVVLEHPAVEEVAAYPVPSDLAEDEVMVSVVPANGASLGAQDVIEWCRTRLPYFAVPRYVAFVDVLPKTSTQKVRKDVLRSAGFVEAFDGGPTGRSMRARAAAASGGDA